MKDLFLEINGSHTIVTVADAEWSAVVRGRVWRWEHHRYCGPLFLNKDGSERKRQPGERHPVWKAYGRWLKRRERAKKRGVR